MLWLIVAVPVVLNVALVVWRVVSRPCGACGERVRKSARRCECGHDLDAPVPLPSIDRARLVNAIGEENLLSVESWLRAGHVHERLGWSAWWALHVADKAVRVGRLDLVKNVLAELEELSPGSRARLMQSAEGSVIIREGLQQQLRRELQLIKVGVEASTRTLDFVAYYNDNDGSFPTDPAAGDVRMNELGAIVSARRDGQGETFDHVRVVFSSEVQARREAPHVRDAGAQVFYRCATSGDLVELRS
jgi:hypothetical protein